MKLAYSVERIANRKNCHCEPRRGEAISRWDCFVAALLAMTCFVLMFLLNAYAAPIVSAQQLLENPEEYDGKTVVYKGEVIGDVMLRGQFAWINLRDESLCLGVFCPKELAGEIEYKGAYGFRGDTISVQGTFHRFCPQHGGDTDIHAQKLTVVQKGEAISYPLEPRKLKAGIILSAIAFALAILHLIVRKFR